MCAGPPSRRRVQVRTAGVLAIQAARSGAPFVSPWTRRRLNPAGGWLGSNRAGRSSTRRIVGKTETARRRNSAQTANPPLSRAPENCPPPKQRWEVQVTPPPSHLLLPASRCRIPTSASRKCCCRSCMTSVCSGPTKRNYRRSFARRLRGHGNGWCHALHDGTACCRRGNLKMFDLNFV